MKPLPCPCVPLWACYYDAGMSWFKGVALELDDANVLANGVSISGTGIVAIIASKLKLSWEGKVNAINVVCVNGKKFSTQNYSLEDFKEAKETPKWSLVGACSFPQTQLVIAE